MIINPPAPKRELKTLNLACDLAVAGGGLAGVCCAITAARAGLKVALVQDRPVLGGNASSEVRLWILGATSHMGNNNRWAREGGVMDELMVENLYRNREGNPNLLDALLLEKVASEPNITLLLNTAVFDLDKHDADTIQGLRAFCSQNSTAYHIQAPLFCDASGDGIVGFLAGAAFRIGAEGRAEFGEKFAPVQPTNELLGHSLYFYSKDVGHPVKFVPPSFALKDITQIPRYRDIRAGDSGCRWWWLEWGGHLDTIHESETIKWELWKVAYGVWNYIKNSGRFPEAETMTLEWVGNIPGKRESRRFEGDYMLTQPDLVDQRHHQDAVSFGGWAIDLHPVDGVYSRQPGCTQWHAKGVYQIPYRCLYSRNIKNLFLAGRIISASHVAFGSTRVMATCASNGQAVGMAAALCRRYGVLPRTLTESPRMAELQRTLLRSGQFIPNVLLNDAEDLARRATLQASSELSLSELKPNGEYLTLNNSWAMMLPVPGGPPPGLTLQLNVKQPTQLCVELRISSTPTNHTPDITLAKIDLPLNVGNQQALEVRFPMEVDGPRYIFVCLLANEHVAVELSEQRVTGVLALTHQANKAVAKSARQEPPAGIGIDTFEFWTPQRRPGGKNFALKINPPLPMYGVQNLTNGVGRPTLQPNAWTATWQDEQPRITLKWNTPQILKRIELGFDTDFDHPMESVLMGHPESLMPFCVQQFQIQDGTGKVLFECRDNHQSRRTILLESAVQTDRLIITLAHPNPRVPAALFEVRCYEQA